MPHVYHQTLQFRDSDHIRFSVSGLQPLLMQAVPGSQPGTVDICYEVEPRRIHDIHGGDLSVVHYTLLLNRSGSPVPNGFKFACYLGSGYILYTDIPMR